MVKYEVEIVRTREQYLQEMEELKREQDRYNKLKTCPLCGESENVKDYHQRVYFLNIYPARFECLNGNCGCQWNIKEDIEEVETQIQDLDKRVENLEESTRDFIPFKNESIIESIKSKFIKRGKIK